MFDPGWPFQPCLIIVGETMYLPKGGAHERQANNGLGWKGLSGTNILAHYERSQITAIKSFRTSTLGVNVISFYFYSSKINYSFDLGKFCSI